MRFAQVEAALTDGHTSGALTLTLPLAGARLTPVVRALRQQSNLWHLQLSSTKMDDAVFKVARPPNLT